VRGGGGLCGRGGLVRRRKRRVLGRLRCEVHSAVLGRLCCRDVLARPGRNGRRRNLVDPCDLRERRS
jgi:hypothetical protein